jgi:hypothetical protein
VFAKLNLFQKSGWTGAHKIKNTDREQHGAQPFSNSQLLVWTAR